MAEWSRRHPESVLYDKEASILLDYPSQKKLRLDWSRILDLEEKTHPETGDKYLVLIFEDNSRLALVQPGGVAFAPSFENSGPLTGLPQAVSLSDFHKLRSQIDHYLIAHTEEPLPRECLDLVMISVAILDGARLVGFDVGDLEEELEKRLNEIEKRKD